MASKTKAELLAEANELGLELTESNTVKEIQEAIDNAAVVTPVEEPEEVPADEPVEAVVAPAPVEPAKNEGSDIANAIREGLASTKEDKRIKITADKSVRSMFSVVRSKRTGEIMLRENATGTLSKVQLQSLEEKEASLQSEEVEPI